MSDREILDLSDRGMDCREWKEIERYVREWVSQYVRQIYFSDNDSLSQRQPTETDKGMLEIMEMIRKGLERYRTESSESNIRKYIDFLLRVHGKLKLASLDSQYKNRHNALVLEYIISKPMSQLQIMKRLGMGTGYSTYRAQLDKGIGELAQIMIRPPAGKTSANVTP